MGRFLNPGNDMFQESLNAQIYVDKSSLIAYLNKVVKTPQKYVCVSRPRRFGKSMAANMLVAYYDRSVDSGTQFSGLAISGDATFKDHLNRYDVIHLNMQDLLSMRSTMREVLALIDQAVSAEIVSLYPAANYLNRNRLADTAADAYAFTHAPFVFVIDEWDAVFRVHKEDKRAQELYLDWLRALLKDKPYVALAYMTGILPIKKYGQHSALNMFAEISMTYARPVSSTTGFTDKEVLELCHRYGSSIETMRSWYDGYSVDGISIYNPRSVVQALTTGGFSNFWTQTETFEALKSYIELDMDGLRTDVVRLIAGDRIPVNVAKFQNDMTTFATADDVLTLLVHLGYLTYSLPNNPTEGPANLGLAWIPNWEVAQEFVSCIEDGGWEEIARSIRMSSDLLDATLAGDEHTVAKGIEQAHQEASSVLRYNDENSLACTLSLAYYAARKAYTLVREMPAGKGFADLIFVPRPSSTKPAMAVELKRDATAESALAQIYERGYAHGLSGHAKQAVLVGVAYNSKTKLHTCRIENGSVPIA